MASASTSTPAGVDSGARWLRAGVLPAEDCFQPQKSAASLGRSRHSRESGNPFLDGAMNRGIAPHACPSPHGRGNVVARSVRNSGVLLPWGEGQDEGRKRSSPRDQAAGEAQGVLSTWAVHGAAPAFAGGSMPARRSSPICHRRQEFRCLTVRFSRSGGQSETRPMLSSILPFDISDSSQPKGKGCFSSSSSSDMRTRPA